MRSSSLDPRLRPNYLTHFIHLGSLDHEGPPSAVPHVPLDHPGLVISEHADKILGPFKFHAPVVWFSFTLLDAPGLVYFLPGPCRVLGATSVLLPPHGVIIFPLRLTAGSGKIVAHGQYCIITSLAADVSESPRKILLVTGGGGGG
jgi:hypothetical protein